MVGNISKKDWKLFRERLPGWQEVYMDKLAEEYVELLESNKTGAEKFWELSKRVKEDQHRPGVHLELRKSDVAFDMAMLMRDGAISLQDIEGFSEEIVEYVSRFHCEIISKEENEW